MASINYLFDQRFNQYVKELCEIVGFTEKIEDSLIKNIGDKKEKK